MTTLGELRASSLRLIGNPEGEGLDDGLIIDAIAAAHDAILPWSPKLRQTSFTGDATLKTFAMPADFYTVEAVIMSETGEILAQAVFAPYSYYGDMITATNSWILLPSGQISFAKTPSTGQIIDLYYCASWTKPTANSQESDVLEPPDYLEYALALYTAAYILMPDSIGIAGIGSYKTRVDSGNPEHNPVEKAIAFLLNLFNQEMNRHPRHQKASV